MQRKAVEKVKNLKSAALRLPQDHSQSYKAQTNSSCDTQLISKGLFGFFVEILARLQMVVCVDTDLVHIVIFLQIVVCVDTEVVHIAINL